jgi:serine/threonine-protein kinase
MAGASRRTSWQDLADGSRIGPYRLLGEGKEGGFGVVWKAEQTDPVRRTVALKLVKPGMASREITERFALERQTVAMMEHPHIARLFDAGTTEDGQPFFAMEWVEGPPLTAYCDSRRLTIPERLELFCKVCSAVHHAHQKGIIHRDLKPSNILVATGDDGDPVPKVIDFGIAKALAGIPGREGAGPPSLAILGTPVYMSPEQAAGDPDIDTRSDLYSLGVILYELLTGQPPLDSAELMRRAMDEVLRIIREEEPRKPSTRVSTLERGTGGKVAEARRTAVGRLPAQLRGDLDWIVLKALSKERDRRYASPSALAEDVRRHLGGEPVEAAPPGAIYRARKFLRRNRGPVAAAFLLAAALLGGTATTLWQWNAAVRQRDAAERQRLLAEQARDAAEELANENLFEFHEALLPLGRHDLLDRLSRAVETYYRELPEELRTPTVRRRESVLETRRGDILYAAGRPEDALEAHRRALRILLDLRDTHPDRGVVPEDLATTHRKIGEILLAQGQGKEAAASLGESVAWARQAIESGSDSHGVRLLAAALAVRGDAAEALGDLPDAIRHRTEAAIFLQSLAESQPESEECQYDLAVTHFRLARSHRQLGDLDAALASARVHRELAEGLAAANPEDARWQREVGAALGEEGTVLFHLGEVQAALDLMPRGLAIFEALASRSPTDERLANDVCQGYAALGDARSAAGDLGGAERAYERAWEGILALVSRQPGNPEFLASAGNIAGLLGAVRMDRGNSDGAAAILRQAVDLSEKALGSGAGGHQGFRLALARSYQFLAVVLLRTGALDAARDAAQRAVEVSADPAGPDAGVREWFVVHGEALAERARIRAALGEPDQAMTDLEEALSLLDRGAVRFADSWFGRSRVEMLWKLGELHGEVGQHDRALDRFRQSVALARDLAGKTPPHPRDLLTLARSLGRTADAAEFTSAASEGEALLAEAASILEQLVTDHPGHSDALAALSVIRQRLVARRLQQQDVSGALRIARSIVAATEDQLGRDPGNLALRHDFRFDLWSLADVLEQAGELSEAESVYRRAFTLADALAREKPEIPDFRHGAAIALARLAMFLREADQHPEARRRIQEALDVLEELRASGAGAALPEIHRDTAISWETKARFEMEDGAPEAAAASLAQALACRQAQSEADPNPGSIRAVAVAHDQLAEALSAIGQEAASRTNRQAAARLLEQLRDTAGLTENDAAWLQALRAGLGDGP